MVYYATMSCNDKNYKPKLYKGVTKQVLRSAIITTKNNLTYYCKSTISVEDIQDISGILEFKEEATKPTDILEDKRNVQVL